MDMSVLKRTNIFRADIEKLFKIQDRLDGHLSVWESRHQEYYHKSFIVSGKEGFSLKVEVYEES